MGWKRLLTAGFGLLLAAGANLAGSGEGNRGLSPINRSYVPAQETPMVLAQTAAPAGAGSAPKADYLLTDCQEIPTISEPTSAERSVDPAYALKNFLQKRRGHYIELSNIRIDMLENAQHGNLYELVGPKGEKSWAYEPKPGYEGKERAVFMAEFEGKRYKIVVTIYANPFYTRADDPEYCRQAPRLIKLNNPRSGLDLNGVSVAFADLPGSTL